MLGKFFSLRVCFSRASAGLMQNVNFYSIKAISTIKAFLACYISKSRVLARGEPASNYK